MIFDNITPSKFKDTINQEIDAQTEKEENKRKELENKKERKPFDLGIENLEQVLPANCWAGDVILIEGPRGTFKETVAVNFLLKGLACGENVLFIRLHDTPDFNPLRRIRISYELRRELMKIINLNMLLKNDDIETYATYDNFLISEPCRNNPWIVNATCGIKEVKEVLDEKLKELEKPDPERNWIEETKSKKDIYEDLFNDTGQLKRTTPKLSIRTYLYNHRLRFTELAFKSGDILPEEFIQEIRDIILLEKEKHNITRVVLDNVGLIGVSYPLLRKSKTASDLFLTAFVHIIRNYEDISLVMTGTTGQYSEADAIISRARVLADTVLKCSFCDVFGDRYIVIEGEGLTTKGPGASKEYGEYTPGAIVPHEHHNISAFEIDLKRLEGLVGFGTANLHRPGITFRTFKEGSIQGKYNDDVERMLVYVFGPPKSGAEKGKEQIGSIVESFTAYDSKIMHDSLDILVGRPLSRTVISTIDEFCRSYGKTNKTNEGNGEDKNSSLDKRVFVDMTDTLEQMVKEEKSDIEKEEDKYNLRYIEPFEVKWKGQPVYALPYYANVMVLAYRKKADNGDLIQIQPLSDILEEITDNKGKLYLRIKSWEAIYNFAQKLHNELIRDRIKIKISPQNNAITHERCLFEYYHYAEETLSCALLDALVSGREQTPGKRMNREEEGVMLKMIRDETIDDNQLKELFALQSLLSESHKYREDIYKLEWNKQAQSLEDEKDDISPYAAVYLCWYSQLRELINKYPELADKLDVCALPGGGFRGDWYIGVAKGSVSIELGKSILRILCSMKEEYKRFAQGVGLPTLRKFYGNQGYFGWPQGEHVELSMLGNIHRAAWTRGKLEGYRGFRNALHMICKQLIRRDIPKDKGTAIAAINKNIKRLARHVTMFGENEL